jgi:site-specific DNA-cytosine methylase
MRPKAMTVTRLSIRDAERAQGLPAGYTALGEEFTAEYSRQGELRQRFRCVGNALPGLVASCTLPVWYYVYVSFVTNQQC